nr:synaptotagmin-like protein 2 isoform X2 [Zootoca vivipara]
MIDLSFLTDEEQEAILKVLQRDSDLKRAEEERVRHLSEKVKDEIQVKNMSGQWFYEAKSRRHREKIHGADIIRASMRRKPFPTELSQCKSDKTKSSWVNNVNKEVFTPPELLGAIKEAELEWKSDESPKVFYAAPDTLEAPQEKTRKLAASPSKQRKNPFNESTLLEDNAKNEQPEHGMAVEKDPHSVENQPKVDVTNHSRVEDPQQAPAEPKDLQRQAGKPPVPKARRNIHKTSDVSLKSEEPFPQAPKRIKQVNGQGSLPRGILKRSSSSSSNDSEVFRLNQTLEPSGKSGLPAPTVLERVAEKSPPPPGESEGFSENSLERLKQVRFSSSVSRKERPQSVELHEGKEFGLLDSNYAKANGDGAGDPGALQSRQTLPSKPPRAHSPALNGNAESQGEGTAPGSHGAKSLGLPSNTLQPEKHPVAGPTIPSESPSKTFPAVGEEEQSHTTKPQIKTKPPSLEQDTSKSTADQQLPKTEDPQVPKIGSADLEQGKQALVEAPSAKTVSKSDKYTAEILKAADESITKVLDWFKRSSSDEEKETLPQISQDVGLAEEMDIPKARESAARTKYKGCSSDMLNLHSSVCEREEPTSKDYRFHEMVNVLSGSPFTKDGSPGSLLLEDQSKTGEVASSSSQGQGIHLNERTCFQTFGHPANERVERAVEGKVETEDKSALCKEPTMLEDTKGKLGLKSVGSSFGKVTERGDVAPNGEGGVKAFSEGANSEQRSGELFNEPKGKESGHLDEKAMQHPSRGNLLTSPQGESKESSLIEVPRKVKNIRAFWEREAMNPKLANKEALLSESTPGSNRIPVCKEECSRIKPVGGSSGYVTGESDNEQGKYNLVTFRKVEIGVDDSGPGDNGIKLPSGEVQPNVMDKSKGSRTVDGSGKIPLSDQRNNAFTELLDANNSRPRPNMVLSKEDGGLQAGGLETERASSVLQQKPHFKIHALKDKADEESKAQMLNPSQFKSLKNFWDLGSKPQSGVDETKAKVTLPRGRQSSTGRYLKELEEVREGTSQAVLEGEQQKPILQGFDVKEQNVLEANRVIPKQAGWTALSPSVNAVPLGNVEFAPAEGKTVRPVEEYIEKINAPPKVEHSLFNSGLQKLLKEACQESLLAHPLDDKKGVPRVELATEVQASYSDQNQQQGAVFAAADGKVSEVAETVSRTLVPPKADTTAFVTNLERLLKDTSDESSSPSRHIVVDVSEQAHSPLEKRRFFNKVMERSHDTDAKNSRVESWETDGTIQKNVPPKNRPVAFKKHLGDSSGLTEDSDLASGKSPNREEGQRDLNATSQEEFFQIPSPKLIRPDARLTSQNRANSPTNEVFETVAEANAPSKRQVNNLNAKLAFLLKELPKTPTNERILKAQIDSVPGELQQRSSEQATRKIIPVSPQMASPLKETVGGTLDRSLDTNEYSGKLLTTMQSGPAGEAAVLLSFSNQENVSAQGNVCEQPTEVAEMVVRTVKPNSAERVALRGSLSKLLKENSEILLKDVAVPKPAHGSLQPHQNTSSIYDKEVIEMIEKATAPSNFRQAELRASFRNLLKEDAEVLPKSQKDSSNGHGAQTERESNRTVDLVCPQGIGCGQEINETVNKAIAPSKLKQREFNSGFRKLLEETPQMQPSEMGWLDIRMKENLHGVHGSDSTTGLLPQEANETVTKSVALEKDDSVFKSSLEKLFGEISGAPLHLSNEDRKNMTDESGFQVAKGGLAVKTQRSVESVPSDFRTEVKIPLKGKAFKQDNQTVDQEKFSGTPERNAVFQKTIQLNLASPEAPLLRRKEDSFTLATAGKREDEYEKGKETEDSPYLDGGSEKEGTEEGDPPKTRQVELLLATRHADGNEEDEDARSVESNLSDESRNSFVGFQRSSTRSEEELNPVMEALKRSSNRQIPSKSLEDIPSATSNKGKVNLPKEDLMLSAEDDQKADQPDENTLGISTAPSFPDSQFSHSEKIKRMSKSAPTFTQEESDDRETDTASDSSYPHGRIKKSPSSLTNLSGSSGLASLSSVSTSVMSIYSGDFGNVDVKGNLQFAIDYVEQLKELHIFVAQGKDLAIADVKRQRSDPYVKSYLLPEKYKLGKRKTSVKKKTLNPVFNEILRYKVDRALLASQRLNVSVWHNDTFGRNSFLGEVELDLGEWDWGDRQNKQMIWYPLKPRTPLAGLDLENRGDMKIALQYVPQPVGGKKTPVTGEVHIWVKECSDLPVLRGNRLNSFVKCTILPDTSRKSRQKTRAVAKTTNPVFNHTMVYDGFRPQDLKEACVELTVWDHNKLANHFLGGLRIGLGTGKSYGTPVDWMDSTTDESNLWERMIDSPNTWVEDTLPLRMLMMAKTAK